MTSPFQILVMYRIAIHFDTQKEDLDWNSHGPEILPLVSS